MKIIKSLLLLIGLISCLSLYVNNQSSYAADIFGGCAGSDSSVCAHKGDSINTYIAAGVKVLMFILGAVSVIVIIIAGFVYVTSGGDAGNTKKAKDMILYAVVGLIVAILSYAIVGYVLKEFK